MIVYQKRCIQKVRSEIRDIGWDRRLETRDPSCGGDPRPETRDPKDETQDPGSNSKVGHGTQDPGPKSGTREPRPATLVLHGEQDPKPRTPKEGSGTLMIVRPET